MNHLKSIYKIIIALKIPVLFFGFSIAFTQGAFSRHIADLPDPFQPGENAVNYSLDTLHKAVKAGDFILVTKLLNEGVNPNILDEKGWTPLDYATKRNRDEIRAVLLENGARTYPKVIPDMFEGPHIRLLDSLTFEVSFLRHDSKNDKSTLVSDRYQISELPLKINGILIEHGDLDFTDKFTLPASLYSDVRKIFIVGDIHGEYDRVFSLLRSNKIIDKDGNWSWGKGHLVFMGDIFDRGNKVTETLWLIFSLEKQAEQSGGKVHLLLGNHELLIFDDDIRYVTDEYYSLCDNVGLSYCGLFNDRSMLGHWIRQKPVMVKINGYLFLHAGISPELSEMELEIDTINKIVWQYLNNEEGERNVAIRKSILGSKGILWYRGFVADGSRKEAIDETTLKWILESYQAKAFIIGHTEVDSISSYYGKKVIDVNIPKSDEDIMEQGLLIRGNKLWVAYDSKKKKKF